MKMITAFVVENREIGKSVFLMALKVDDMAKDVLPGQFIEIYVNREEHLLPRPISIFDINIDKGLIYVVYQVVGKGTDYFSRLKIGELLKIVGPLGNGYPMIKSDGIYLIGGGIGIPPLYYLCKALKETQKHAKITIILGFRKETFLVDDFKRLDVKTLVSTEDGRQGFKGNVLSVLEQERIETDLIYSCGPKIMLQKVSEFANKQDIRCYVSVEERMACGIGACVGCAVKIKDNDALDGWKYKKVCKDGPVFNSKEVIWDE